MSFAICLPLLPAVDGLPFHSVKFFACNLFLDV